MGRRTNRHICSSCIYRGDKCQLGNKKYFHASLLQCSDRVVEAEVQGGNGKPRVKIIKDEDVYAIFNV